jgi:hypothetical protein
MDRPPRLARPRQVGPERDSGQDGIAQGSGFLLALHLFNALEWPVPSEYRGGWRNAAPPGDNP